MVFNEVNSENIITEELQTKGISFSGFYNHNSSYYDGCDIQYLYLYMTGNCLNNNTEVYCVILGNVTSYSVILKV